MSGAQQPWSQPDSERESVGGPDVKRPRSRSGAVGLGLLTPGGYMKTIPTASDKTNH